MLTARTITLLYCIFASLGALLLATTMPAMQNADEEAHAFRADQVSRLVPAGMVLADGEFGGEISSGLVALRNETTMLRFHPERKVSRSMFAPIAWGAAVQKAFPNTAIYPPFFYLPAAAAAAAARASGIQVRASLVLMRLATGIATIVVAAIAIALAGNAALWLYAVLLLPMSLALSAAVSQDGPMLACTALAAALFRRIQDKDVRHPHLAFAGMCVLLAMVGMARAPYVAFALLPLVSPMALSWRVTGAAFIFVCGAAWSAGSAVHFPLPIKPDGVVSPALQIRYLISHFWRVPLIGLRSILANDGLVARSFIGQLGWLDVDLPNVYRLCAALALLLAAAAAWRPAKAPGRAGVSLIKALAVLGAAGAVILALYTSWTVVGSPVVDGMQGRYFLTPALMLAIFMGNWRGRLDRWQSWLAMPVLAFPMISIAVAVHAVVLRYYF